jgi:outer membrane protein OmpA-like peptidoglycan-associated protein
LIAGQFSFVRAAVVGTAALLLSACQSVPAQKGFNAAQIAVLQQENFVPVDESYDWFLTLPSRLLFASDQSELEPDKLEDIASLARNLVNVGITTAVVEGHTDSSASDAYNVQLSQARAATVARPMAANGMTFTPDQIIGKGEAYPISDNSTPEGRQDNRRVVILVSPE